MKKRFLLFALLFIGCSADDSSEDNNIPNMCQDESIIDLEVVCTTQYEPSAKNNYTNPEIIVTQAEAEANEKTKSNSKKTWVFESRLETKLNQNECCRIENTLV